VQYLKIAQLDAKDMLFVYEDEKEAKTSKECAYRCDLRLASDCKSFVWTNETNTCWLFRSSLRSEIEHEKYLSQNSSIIYCCKKCHWKQLFEESFFRTFATT